MPKKTKNLAFPVVGIGASAGGLEALKSLISEIPDNLDEDIAFVVIQHLDPDHESVLDSLLGKNTEMETLKIKDDMKIEPNHVYVNPPQKKIGISDLRFKTSKVEDNNTPKLPIDHFFRSLAKDLGKKAISVVLSGTGSDGSTGLKEIKDAGGMTIAQKVEEAEYKGMPQSAINTGLVDYVLPLKEIPHKILNYIRHPYIDSPQQADIKRDQFRENAPRIFKIIRQQMDHDFSNYKKSTMKRRISRRIAVNQIENINEYYKYLKNNQKEVKNLFKDLLISVTNFFREPEVFESLQKEVLPDLLENHKNDSNLRIWVPGCSTGEEAYSIGMLLTEIGEDQGINPNIQIFATDLNQESIEFARKGIYPESIAQDISQKRLKRFFGKKGDKYKISNEIQEMVIFAKQNLIKDPPLSRMDLISCRNLLIYMNQDLQKKVIPMFHRMLKKNGVLVLGSSESIGDFTNLFKAVDKKKSIYRQKKAPEKDLEKNFGFPTLESEVTRPIQDRVQSNKELNIQKLAEEVMLEKYTHPGVLIDENYDILYFHSNTEKYLSPPKGDPSLNILEMARDKLRYKLTAASQEAKKKEETVIRKDVEVRYKNEINTIDLIVEPVSNLKDSMNLQMIIFREKTETREPKDPGEKLEINEDTEKMEENQGVKALEKELKSTKEDFQSTIEELETSNEELKSRNEELKATNEEFRSTNEELKTAREEAESTNEELTTVNQELEEKIKELSKEKNDMRNLLENIEIAIIFLDKNLQLRRFTPEATQIFNVIDSDIGRPLTDINSNIVDYENMNKDLNKVIDTLQKKSKEIRTESGDWYNMEILPYRTTENIVDGLVITFKDITKIKLRRLKRLRRLATVLEDSNDAITVQDLEGNIQEWNKGAKKMYGYSEKEAKKLNIRDIVPEKYQQKELKLIERVKSGEQIESFKTKRETKDGQVLDIWVTITKLMNEEGDIYAVATTERDLNEIKRIKETQNENNS